MMTDDQRAETPDPWVTEPSYPFSGLALSFFELGRDANHEKVSNIVLKGMIFHWSLSLSSSCFHKATAKPDLQHRQMSLL